MPRHRLLDKIACRTKWPVYTMGAAIDAGGADVNQGQQILAQGARADVLVHGVHGWEGFRVDLIDVPALGVHDGRFYFVNIFLRDDSSFPPMHGFRMGRARDAVPPVKFRV